MVVMHQHAMTDHSFVTGKHAFKKHAHHIPDHKEETADNANLNHVILHNILHLMEVVIIAQILLSQITGTKTEINVLLQDAQLIQSLQEKEDVNNAKLVPIQIHQEDYVFNCNALIDKEFKLLDPNLNALIAQ